MGLDSVVTLDIVSDSANPTRAGFGTILCMAYHTGPKQLETYAQPSELVDDGFDVASPAYRMALVAFSQNPRPANIMLGRREHAPVQVVELTPVKTTAGFHYTLEVVDSAGVVTSVDYTVQPSDTVALICTALAALIDPLTDLAAVATATKVTITGVAGKLFNLRKLPKPENLKIKDVSTDPGLAADLATIEAIDPSTWYALAFDHTSSAGAQVIATFTEARRKISVLNTSDSECLESGVTTDIASVLKASNTVRTELLYNGNETLSYSALAWAAAMLPKDPGSATWCYKNLRGGPVADNLSAGQASAAKAKRLNTYQVLGGISVTLWGQSPDAGFIDIAIGTDWLYARIQEAVFTLFANQDKVPFTDSGVDMVRNVILAVFKRGIKMGFLAGDPAPTLTFPKVKDIDSADKKDRKLPDGAFTATFAGAIHTVVINGKLSF